MKYLETGIPGFERPRFFHGQLLTLEDFELLLRYPREKLRLLNRYVHGSGIITGLWPENVRLDEESGAMVIEVTPGMAITPQGDELVVARRLTETADGPFSDGIRYLYLVYREIVKNKVPGMSGPDLENAGEHIDETTCDYSRVVEGYSLELSTEPPARPKRRIEAKLLRRFLADHPSAGVLQKRLGLGDDLLDTLEGEPRVFLGVLHFEEGKPHLHRNKTIELRSMHLSHFQLESLLLHHTTVYDNPHGVTAEQVGALKSLQGIGPSEKCPEHAEITLDSPNETVRITTEGNHIHLETRPGDEVQPVGGDVGPGLSRKFAREDHSHELAADAVNARHIDVPGTFTSSDGSICIDKQDFGRIDMTVAQKGTAVKAVMGWCSIHVSSYAFGQSRWIRHGLGPKAVAVQTALEEGGDNGNLVFSGDMEAFPRNRIFPGITKAPAVGVVLDIQGQCFQIKIKNNSIFSCHFTVRWWVFDADPVEHGDVTREDWSGSGVDY
ncbi:MAG: hypothetical protein QNK37_01610 [Acidobacteriota bacterium]|nr:hypothetical protein [Acidobacteriota bacterium]